MCRRWPGLFVTGVFCVLFLMAGVGISSHSKTLAGGRGSGPARDVNDANGPTVLLSYDDRVAENNPTSSFMYFVPLISPTLVDMETNADNEQRTRLVSYQKKVTSKSFYVSCEFEMTGRGFFKTTFNAPEMIAIVLDETGKGEQPMTKALDYIRFEGEGIGCIEVWGTITDSTETVTEVDVSFNARGQKSPVTIGLYSIGPENGQYKYESKYNELIARVATLAFRKCEGNPRMGVKVVSVNKATKPNGFVGRVRGVIANFFIDPPVVSRLGNQTMLDFGLALLKERLTFTFPKAKNIRESKTVAINSNQ
ncbi:MAG: hypothetical protein ABII09_04860 [Planctomycetota bacterium]